MNSWNFNELTQQDILDYKACQRQDGSIYGVPDKSECQKGKEIKKEDLVALSKKANAGDKKARAQIEQYQKVQKEQQAKAKAEKEAAKKKAEKEGKKGKKGKGKKGGGKKGGGKKGGGKGKGGAAKGKGGAAKGGAAKGGGSAQMQANARKAQQQAQQSRNKRAQEIRTRIADLQKSLRQIKNPEVRKALEEQISLALKSVSALQQGQSVGTGSPGDIAKAPQAPAAPQAPKEGQTA